MALVFMALLFIAPAFAHPHSPLGDRSKGNRDYYIQLGEAVHGGFGPLIALGIRLGDDAMKTLGAGPRQLDITYFAGAAAPCPCVADGIMLVTASSPGQGTLRVAPEKAGDDLHGRVLIRHRSSGRAVEYVIPASIQPIIAEALKGGPDRRWSLIMDAPEAQLFTKRMIEKAQ
jgi:hypothetical protein